MWGQLKTENVLAHWVSGSCFFCLGPILTVHTLIILSMELTIIWMDDVGGDNDDDDSMNGPCIEAYYRYINMLRNPSAQWS